MKTNKLHIVSLGCTKNLVDTEVMLGRLRAFEMTDAPEEADVIIVNTCGFIDAAKTESLNTVLSLDMARKEDSLLVMAGCMSERYREDLAEELTEVDIFTGVGDYDRIDELLAQKRSTFSDRIFLIDGEERIVTGSTYHAYVKLSEGCNQSCSFCAIPSFKGRLHSRSLESIVAEVEALSAQGYYDFSFISQDSSSFQRDLGVKDGLIALIERIGRIDGVKSARILYLYPTTTSEALIAAIGASDIFHNYFDIPLQHIDDAMLKRMKRGAGREQTLALLERMKALPEAYVRTAFIVGHPGETEEAFDTLYDFADRFGFDRMSIFAYSDEEGTAAYTMPEKSDDTTIDRRTELLGRIADEAKMNSLRKQIGTKVRLIIDGPSAEHDYLLSARDLRWAPEIDGEIYVNDHRLDGPLRYGVIYDAEITGLVDDVLTATVHARS